MIRLPHHYSARVLLALLVAVTPQLLPASVDEPQPTHAEGFELAYHDGYTVLTITQAYPNARRPQRYLLIERNREVPSAYRDLPRIYVPVERVVTAAGPLLAQFEVLEAPDRVVGHDHTGRIYSERFRSRVEAGRLRRVGEPPHMDIERVVALEPDVVLINALGPQSETEHKLREAGMPVLVVGDWLEHDPVGRAEWILVAGALLQREREAAEYIDGVRERYQDLEDEVGRARRGTAHDETGGPTVLVNAPYQGTWSVPGGRSYMARLLEHAGARYPWSGHDTRGALHLELESVINAASSADVWINPGDSESLADVLRIDPRLHVFEAYQQGHVYSFTARTRSGGANDYFERGALEPDRILADLIAIFHPEVLPEHRLRYFRQLR